VIPHAADETKRVAPDVIASAEQGPQSNAGSSPAALAFFRDERRRLINESTVLLHELSTLLGKQNPKGDDYYNVNKALHILWNL